MNTIEIQREITPLKQNDCFLVFNRIKNYFEYPIHFHPEYEINLIKNANGLKRIVGDHIKEIQGEWEMVLTGPNIYHGWIHNNHNNQDSNEITIQFTGDIFGEGFLNKNQMLPLKKLLYLSDRGISFDTDTILSIFDKIQCLSQIKGFNSVLSLFALINTLAESKNFEILSSTTFTEKDGIKFNSRRIEKVYNYIMMNHRSKIKLSDVADIVNMSEASFSRFFKQRTGKTFIYCLNEIRMGYAARMLLETTWSVSEICYQCGFNNLSNFNRYFKTLKNCSPGEFRNNFSGTKTFI